MAKTSKLLVCAGTGMAFFLSSSIASAADDEWEDWGDDWSEQEQTKEPLIPVNGFFESTLSYRTQDSEAIAEEWVVQDLRGQLQTYYQGKGITASYKGELFFDGITSEWHGINREAYIGFSPASAIDVRAGRQVLTWGTGDLLFLNDFFPKDWVAFFSGYDQQYLKAPSDAFKISGFSDAINVDLVWSPEFDADNYVTGDKLVYYSPFASDIVAAPPELQAPSPGHNLKDGEIAARLYKTIQGVEYALYFYKGFFKTPEGYDPVEQTPYFPELRSMGASARANAFGGITNLEYAYWNSDDSNDGKNPLVPNNQSRVLVGYESEIVRNLTASFQLYSEYTHNYERLKEWYPTPDDRPRKARHVLTTRWTLSTLQSNLVYSLFMFYSPSDKDFYLIPNVTYRMGDSWQFNGGANLLGGDHDYTLFGQMEENSNLYVRAKYIF